jgi:uncharacterized Zn finger protein (UPF0148 family)
LAELQKHRRPTYDATTICSDCSWSGDISIACPSCGKTNTDRADIRAAAAKAVQNTETHHESALEPAIANGNRASVSDAEFLAAGHRPGWRFNTDAAAKQRVLDAYKKADEERERAWKMGRDSDEWEANTATLSQLPDVQSGSKVGDACNIGGVSGHMGYNDEGKLVCQLSEHAPASDDAINDRESAYRAYETDLQNSYKIPSLVADRQRKVQEYDPQGRESNSFISENGNDPCTATTSGKLWHSLRRLKTRSSLPA